MSPKPATVSSPTLWRSVPGAGTPKFGPPTLVPVHPVAGQESPMWRKTPVARVQKSESYVQELESYKEPAAKSPACTVEVSPGRVAVPTSVQCVPSAESYPVIVPPSRTSRSQRGADAETLPVRPG